MPTVGDYIKATQDRLWAIFEADTGTGGWAMLVKSGNRIKRTGPNPFPPKTSAAPADFGEAELMLASGQLSGLTGPAPQTFANLQTSPPCAFTADNRLTYSLKVRWPDLRANNATALLARTEFLLLYSGAKLSLSGSPLAYVQSWGPISVSHAEEDGKEAGGSLRLIQRIQIPVHYLLDKADLLG